MKLIRPARKYGKSWRESLGEFRKDDKTIKLWEVLGDSENLDEIMRIARLHSQGRELPDGWVPYDLLWLVDGEEFIGIASIRHKLNADLELWFGHIGYEIRPSKRGNGYGNKILELSLEKAKKLGLRKVLLASFEANVASWKIIEKNGGKLEDKILTPGENELTRRYWINL